jgi:hypothetical protein
MPGLFFGARAQHQLADFRFNLHCSQFGADNARRFLQSWLDWGIAGRVSDAGI